MKTLRTRQKNMKVSQLVFLGFGVIFGLMGIIAVTSQGSTNNFVEATGWVAHTSKVEADLNALEKTLVDAETGQRGFLFTGESDFLEPYNQAQKNLNNIMARLKFQMRDNAGQLTRLETVENIAQAKMSELKETVELKKARKEKELKALVLSKKGKQLMDDIREKLAEMTQVEDRLLAERQKKAAQIQQLSMVVSWGGTAVAIIFGSVISWIIVRLIVQPISEVASAIASSANEIAATVEQHERVAAEQAMLVSQTTTTMDELNASSRQAAEQAEAAATAARQVAQQVMRLSNQTRQISSITDVVSELATQTNMLALNAAVEAVRAGDGGKGFGVVASEIRRLADESKKSAQNINSLIADIQMLSDSTARIGGENMQSESIVTAINNIVVNSQQISLTAQQQAIAIQQVVAVMNAINAGAKQTASGISQTKIGTQQLNEAAQHLKALGVG